MSLVRYWSPLEEIKQLENEVTSLFRNYATDSGVRRLRVDIEENPDQYTITADMPGIKMDELELEATSQYLEIQVNQKMETENKDEEENGSKYILRERIQSKLARRITFDKPINTQKAHTTLKDGVLTVILPKLEEAKSVKLIPETN